MLTSGPRAAVVLAATTDNDSTAGACGLGGTLLVIFSLIAIIVSNPIKPVGHKEGWFKLKGCSRDLLATLPQGRPSV
ncbi:hypothetical protein [Haloferula sargassicola]|uniref:Uncharacterized protein n=1 Tax=Haloferula sargassicola TaxID=490096 RepID=A0ABP9UR00_9BACT